MRVPMQTEPSPIVVPRAVRIGAVAVGAFALGAFAIGALAIGRLAVGRLTVGDFSARKARIDHLSIGTLEIEKRIIRSEGEE
jgi:hypothetical protein